MNRLEVAAADGELFFDGSLTVENAAEIVQKIRRTMASSTDCLVITVAAGATADVSFLQILCSAHRTAQQENKCLRLNTEKSGGLDDKIRAAGFLRKKGCSRDRDGSCLWVREG